MRASCLGLKSCEGSEGRNFSVSVETGALTIRPKISKFSKRGQMVRKSSSWEKFQKIWDESQMEWKFPSTFFRAFEYTSRGCALFRNLCEFPIFFAALASSFGRDHSELDISCKDDAHSMKETL